MNLPFRIVFDCNVFFQAFLGPQGPARRLLRGVEEGSLILFVTQYVLEELKRTLEDERIVAKYDFAPSSVDQFFALITKHAKFVDHVPHVFDFPRDPKDAHYVDPALAVNAKLIVSRDKDLLSLRDAGTVEGRDFLSRFPTLLILTPPEVLKLLATTPSPE
jgi:putative PIN family toxin of toxin-antitoxin system